MFNFRKIASVISSAVMISSTVALAAAAVTYPAPFIKNGTPDVNVVMGTGAGAQFDVAAVANIRGDLESQLAKQTTTTTGGTTTTTGSGTTVIGTDKVQFRRSSDEFNLGNKLNDFYTTLDDDADELPVLLKAGVYKNDAKDEFDYEQKITPSGLILNYSQDADFNNEKPFVGFTIADGSAVLNYTLDFTDNAEGGDAIFTDIEDTMLPLLGKEFYVSAATATANGVKLTVLDTANSALIAEGETATITIGGQSFDVTVTLISNDGTTSEAVLDVNGQATDTLAAGNTEKLGTDTYVIVKKIYYSSKDTGVSRAEVSIGNGQIILENGQEVKINGKDISETADNDPIINAYITNSSTDITEITLEWILGDDEWLMPGDELVMPGFGGVKLAMGDWVVPKDEKTTVTYDGSDKHVVKTTLKGGDVTIPVLYGTSGSITGIGKDADELLVTKASNAITSVVMDKDSQKWFAATAYGGDDGESYLFELSKVESPASGSNYTEIKDVATGATHKIETGDSKDFGLVRITLNTADETSKVINFDISAIGSGNTAYADRVVTADGMLIYLPVANTTVATQSVNHLNMTSRTSYSQYFVEEAASTGNIAAGTQFSSVLGYTSTDNKATVSSVTIAKEYETSDSSEDFLGYVESDMATKTLRKTSGDQDTLEVTYGGDESYAEVFMASEDTKVTVDTTTTPVEEEEEETTAPVTTVTTLGEIALTDEQAVTSTKNLIVIGGSCINSLSASLLGVSYPTCGTGWETATTVGSGEFLVQTFAHAGTKVATVIAGYNAGDTKAGVTKLITAPSSFDLTVGKVYKGTQSGVVDVSVTETAAATEPTTEPTA